MFSRSFTPPSAWLKISAWRVSPRASGMPRRSPFSGRYDLAVVGAGIIGLATALAAARRGLRVVVVDRDAQANGASVRNFGFVTVTGQDRESMWARARRSREVWRDVADAAGIPIVHTGL